MNKLFLTILVIALSFSSYAQSSSIFDKFEDYEYVTTVVVTKQAFRMLKKISSDTKEGQEFQSLVDGLNDLKIFTTKDAKTSAEMQATFNQYIKNKKLIELMRVRDKDANVKIYIKEGKDEDHVSEFLMLVDEMNVKHSGDRGTPEVVIISLTGDIDLNNISKITTQMNIPGGKHMKNVEKE